MDRLIHQIFKDPGGLNLWEKFHDLIQNLYRFLTVDWLARDQDNYLILLAVSIHLR